MALADTANLMVKLSLGGNFLSQIGKATTGLSKFDTKLGKVESRAFRAGQQIGTGIRNAGRLAAVGIGFLVSQVGLGLQSLIELEQQQAQTNAVIKSTGGIAGVTADEVGRLSEKYESLNATIGDEVIRSGENLLLTFTNIRKEAFEPALAAVLDMNTALGKGPEGLTSTALLVGKALQDPEKGLSRLGRAVGGFSDETIKAVKEAVKQNDTFKAQTIILAELDKRYKGSFIAQGDTTAGKVAKFTDSIDDLQRALAKALLPTLGNVADALSKTLADPKVVAGVEAFGKSLAGLITPANLAEAGRILQDVFSAASAAAPVIAAAAGTVGKIVGTAVSMFRSLPPEIQALAVGAFAVNKLTGGLVTNLAGGLISGVLKQLVSGVVNVRGASVIVTGGVGGVPGTAAGGGLGLASKVFLIGEAIGLALLVNEVRNGIAQGNTDAAKSIAQTSREWLAQNPSKADLAKGLAGVEAGMLEIARTDPQGLTTGESLAELRGIRLAILEQLKRGTQPGNLANRGLGNVTPGGNLASRGLGNAISSVELGAILKRGRDAGFSPTSAGVLATHNRNLVRAAEATRVATERVRAEAARTTAAAQQVAFNIRDRAQAPPVVNTYVNVNVSARGIVTKNVRDSRSGPQGGSRELSRRNSIG